MQTNNGPYVLIVVFVDFEANLKVLVWMDIINDKKAKIITAMKKFKVQI